MDKQLITERPWTTLKGHLSKTPSPTQIAQSLNIWSKCPSQLKGYFVDWPSVRWAKTRLKSCLRPHCQQMKFYELVVLFCFGFFKVFHSSHWKRQVVDCREGSDEGHPTHVCWSHSSLPASATAETAQVRFAKQNYLFKYADNSAIWWAAFPAIKPPLVGMIPPPEDMSLCTAD